MTFSVDALRSQFPILASQVRGKPLVYLYGGARARADHIGLDAIDISLTHLDSFALASVVCTQQIREQEPDEARPRLIGFLKKRGLLVDDDNEERLPDVLPPIRK